MDVLDTVDLWIGDYKDLLEAERVRDNEGGGAYITEENNYYSVYVRSE